MKTTVRELRTAMAAAMVGDYNQTTSQLTEIYAEINTAHEAAVKEKRDLAYIRTRLDLTIQAQKQLVEDEFRVEDLPYEKGETNPFLYQISWSYK